MGSVLLTYTVLDQRAVVIESPNAFATDCEVSGSVGLLMVAREAVSLYFFEFVCTRSWPAILDTGKNFRLNAEETAWLSVRIGTDLNLAIK